MPKVKKNKKEYNRGVTLIEVLVSIFVITIVSISFYGMFLLAGKLVYDGKLRTVGTYLANEEMENIKSMHYNLIGTVGGTPSGEMAQQRTIAKGGYQFQVETEIKYFDDELDGLFPEDATSADYKTARIEISWPSYFKNNAVVLISSIYPEISGQEEGGGILSINAINFEGTGIANCEVKIENPDVNPPVEIYTSTDNLGNVILYGMAASNEGYQITLERTGYERVVTYPSYPETSFCPLDEHIPVIEGELNIKSLEINELGRIKLIAKDEKGDPVGNTDFDIYGGRILGHTVESEPQPVYNYNQENISADALGEITIEDISPGTYYYSIGDSSYQLVRANPSNPFDLPAGGDTNVEATAVKKTLDSLLVILLDSESKEPISEIPIVVSGSGDFNKTEISDVSGGSFFWEEGMEAGEYSISITADGWENYTGSVDVNDLTEKEVFLVSQGE